MLNINTIKALETANFKLVTEYGRVFIKATTPLAKTFLRLKGKKNPVSCDAYYAEDAIKVLVELEESCTKLAAI